MKTVAERPGKERSARVYGNSEFLSRTPSPLGNGAFSLGRAGASQEGVGNRPALGRISFFAGRSVEVHFLFTMEAAYSRFVVREG